MSRQVDITKPLSDEDREYLVAHGDHDLVAQADRIAASDAEVEDVEAETEEEETEENSDDSDEDDEDSEETEDDEDSGPYAGWTKADLKAEAGKRELPKSGNVSQLKARLVEDDESEDQS